MPQPNSEKPSVVRAARLDVVARTWERLPDSESIGYGPWFTAGSELIDPALGCADGGDVNNWARDHPFGSIFDTATLTWQTMPDFPDDETTDRTLVTAARAAIVFGGVEWRRDDSGDGVAGNHLLDDGWIWHT